MLTGRGNKVIQPHVGDSVADVVPVDYIARLIIGSAATLSVSSQDFQVPKAAETPQQQQQQQKQQQQQQDQQSNITSDEQKPSDSTRGHKRSSSQASRISIRSSTIYQNHTASSKISSLNQEPKTVPVIYQVTTANMRPVTWRVGYEAMRQYWIRTTNVNLPPAKSYFTATANGSQRNSTISASSPAGGLSRARTVMNSLRGYYMNSGTDVPIVNSSASITPMASHSSDRLANGSSNNAKRNSHRLSRTVDKAAKLSHTMKDSMYSSSSSSANSYLNNQNTNTINLAFAIRNIDVGMELDPNVIVPEDADAKFWVNYLTNASFGIHYYVCQEVYNLRLPTPIYGWSCGIQPSITSNDEDGMYYQYVFGRQVKSVVFSGDQIVQRTARMVAHIKGLLMHNTPLVVANKDDEWLTDLDDALDDWCQDNDIMNADKERRMALGKWRRKVGSNDESVKVIVLNDKRVNQAITQITQNAGVPKQTAVNEAMKILMRMSERTQLAFVWFTGSFLKSLFDDMFENVRILDESLRAIRQSTMGKRVVYVPVSKSMLDPLLVWYIAIRYHLPVPALACDEVMSSMGPISDVYRLAGAYYVKRDKSKRSPLNSAVTAAYTQVLLREHGALAFCLERSRSRTGKFQEAYPDGFVDMIIEATLQTNQAGRTSSNTSSVINRIVSSEMTTPPASPDSPSSGVASPTMSIDNLAHNFSSSASVTSQQHNNKKVHKDVVFVPINITYENVPELSLLIDEVLDQQPVRTPGGGGRTRSASQSTPTPSMSLPIGRPAGGNGVMRPSEAKDRRKTLMDGLEMPKKCGRVTFGVGPLISVQEVAEDFHRKSTE